MKRIELQTTIKKGHDGLHSINIPKPIVILADLNKGDSVAVSIDRKNRIIIEKNKKVKKKSDK